MENEGPEIIRDPIEDTPEYKGAMVFIQQQLNKEFDDNNKDDTANALYCQRKRSLLAHYGIEWKSPLQLNKNLRDRIKNF